MQPSSITGKPPTQHLTQKVWTPAPGHNASKNKGSQQTNPKSSAPIVQTSLQRSSHQDLNIPPQGPPAQGFARQRSLSPAHNFLPSQSTAVQGKVQSMGHKQSTHQTHGSSSRSCTAQGDSQSAAHQHITNQDHDSFWRQSTLKHENGQSASDQLSRPHSSVLPGQQECSEFCKEVDTNSGNHSVCEIPAPNTGLLFVEGSDGCARVMRILQGSPACGMSPQSLFTILMLLRAFQRSAWVVIYSGISLVFDPMTEDQGFSLESFQGSFCVGPCTSDSLVSCFVIEDKASTARHDIRVSVS